MLVRAHIAPILSWICGKTKINVYSQKCLACIESISATEANRIKDDFAKSSWSSVLRVKPNQKSCISRR